MSPVPAVLAKGEIQSSASTRSNKRRTTMLEILFPPKLADGYGTCAIRQGISKMGWGRYHFAFVDGINPGIIQSLPAAARGGIIVFPDEGEYLVEKVVSRWASAKAEQWFREHRNTRTVEWKDAHAIGRFFTGLYRIGPPATTFTTDFSSKTSCLEVIGVPFRRLLELASHLASMSNQPVSLVRSHADGKLHLVAR